MMAHAIGAEHGITSDEWQEALPRLEEVQTTLKRQRDSGELGFYDLPYQDVSSLLHYTREVRQKIENFVVIGIGGSALGGIALQNALRHPHYNLLPHERRDGPRVFFLDNIDPDMLVALFEILDLRKTLFHIVTKSGSTAETMSTFLLVRQFLIDEVGDLWRDRVVFTTDPVKGDLRKIATEERIATFAIPPNIGGRFSVFTPVGLLPAAIAGIDVRVLLNGAAMMEERFRATIDPKQNPAYVAALLLYLANVAKGKRIVVMMPYVQALKDVADWFRQIWAESLGKKYDLAGNVVNIGQTPIKALGATDQHSQLQLYVEGPCDKVILFVAIEWYRVVLPFPEAYSEYGSLGYFAGHTMEELIQAERSATELALTRNHRPNATFLLPGVSPESLGAFLYLLEVQTVASGVLYRINPLDQPGVEEGKEATYALMGRKGYEEKKKVIEREMRRDERYIIKL
jgi:glucose-6-phosphate isomerase